MANIERGSTLLLRGVIGLIGLVGLAVYILALPIGIRSDEVGYDAILIGLYLLSVPFYYALYQAFKLMSLIDKNKAFSALSVRALRKIKRCVFGISAGLAIGTPYVFRIADRDDAPGALAMWLIIVFVTFVIATAAGVFQRLLQHAVDIKSENDLTV